MCVDSEYYKIELTRLLKLNTEIWSHVKYFILDEHGYPTEKKRNTLLTENIGWKKKEMLKRKKEEQLKALLLADMMVMKKLLTRNKRKINWDLRLTEQEGNWIKWKLQKRKKTKSLSITGNRK